MRSFDIWDSSKKPFFWFRWYVNSLLFRMHFKIPSNYNYLAPGLEIKFACEEAEKAGAKTYFLGAELNQKTW